MRCSNRVARMVAPILLFGIACGEDKEGESSGANSAPIADAGLNQTVRADSTIILAGDGSYDPDGDPITYSWSFDRVPEGSVLADMESPFTVNDSAESASSFTPDAIGTYVVALVVTDGRGLTSPSDHTLVEITAGDEPVSDAGADQEQEAGSVVTVDGSASYDPLGRALGYAWTFARLPDSSTLTGLADPTVAGATFTPDVGGLYIVALVVDNGISQSSPDTSVIRVSSEDAEPPVASAGEDIEAEDCSAVALDGSDSYDPNGESLTYLWDLQARPAGSTATTTAFSDRTSKDTTFYPDVAGDYSVSLAVYDGTSWSVPDVLALTATERSYNAPPAVYPGAPQNIDAGEAICEEVSYTYICAYCDAVSIPLGADAAVTDADSDPYSVTWEVVSGSATITDTSLLSTEAELTTAQPIEIDACEITDYEFRLTVTDCTGASASQTVVHHVSCCGVTASDGESVPTDTSGDTATDGTGTGTTPGTPSEDPT